VRKLVLSKDFINKAQIVAKFSKSSIDKAVIKKKAFPNMRFVEIL